jgi:phosphate transport system protein
MSDHTVRSFDDELLALGRFISEMGGIAETMFASSVEALVRSDTQLAQRVIATDQRLDTLEREIEEKAILTIAKRQPMAVDLRSIITSIRIAADLERVGDLAKNIGKRAVAMNGQFTHMADLALERLKTVLDAYMRQDVETALEVWRTDDEIDTLYNSLFRELLTYMMEDPRNIGFCTHLLFCAKNVERIGDHATNIAETIHYLVTGKTITIERPRSDEGYVPLEIGEIPKGE